MDGEPEYMADSATFGNVVTASDSVLDVEQARLESLEKKAVHLRLMLEKDFKAADMKWSLFVAAAFSFRYESCLKPFPPAFLKDGAKDMDALLSLITDVPALDIVLQQLDNLENLTHMNDIIDLLFYVLVKWKEPTLRTVPVEAHESVLSKACSTSTVKPQYLFQVINSHKSTAENKWIELRNNKNAFFAFHGNRLENFYRMLNFGLQNTFAKVKTNNNHAGSGVLLTPDLAASLPHSHGGFGWGASCIGGHLSCVAMVEVIDLPSEINYHNQIHNEGDGVNEIVKNADKMHKEVKPNAENHAQYLVTNGDLMRLRYLLVYAKQPASSRLPSAASGNSGGLRQWFARNKLFSILLGYGIMLATIGFANNQPINYYYRTLLSKLDMAYNLKM